MRVAFSNSCIVAFLIGTLFFCFYAYYPEKFGTNYLTNILEMTKEKLGYTSNPSTAGLPLSPGMAMTHPCTDSCNMCLILSELKLQEEGGAMQGTTSTQPLMSAD